MEKTVQVTNPSGIHASPAAQIAQIAMQHNATVTISCQDKVVDARSILGILSLGLAKGSEFVLRVEGEESATALEALTKLFMDGFE